MLTVTGAAVAFGRVTALDGIDLHVATGEVLAILGPSGCGKSTLLRAVAGLQPLGAGVVCWDGEQILDWFLKERPAPKPRKRRAKRKKA